MSLQPVSTFFRAVLLFAFWLLLVDATQAPQLLTGAGVALVVAILTAGLTPLREVPARLRPSMLRHGLRPFVLLVTDTVRVICALANMLVHHPERLGSFRAVRYTALGDDPEDAARRLLTEWGGSLGSNRYVIGCDEQAGILLVHELVDAPGPLDPLEAG